MSGMITAIEIEKMYGVPAGVIRSAIKRFQIRNQKTGGLISIAIQDAEPIIFDYHARQGSYTWQDVARRFHASTANQYLRKVLDSILPHYRLTSGTYYPIRDVEDVLAHLEDYHIKKYKDKFYYLEGGRKSSILQIILPSLNSDRHLNKNMKWIRNCIISARSKTS